MGGELWFTLGLLVYLQQISQSWKLGVELILPARLHVPDGRGVPVPAVSPLCNHLPRHGGQGPAVGHLWETTSVPVVTSGLVPSLLVQRLGFSLHQ